MRTMQPRIVASESVVCANVDDEAVLLNVDTGIYFGLNAVGTRIWGLLAQGATEEEIVFQLAGAYKVEPAKMRPDVSAFLALLAAKGLTRVVDG